MFTNVTFAEKVAEVLREWVLPEDCQDGITHLALGMRVSRDGREYLICSARRGALDKGRYACLVNVETGKWAGAVEVQDPMQITYEEAKALLWYEGGWTLTSGQGRVHNNLRVPELHVGDRFGHTAAPDSEYVLTSLTGGRYALVNISSGATWDGMFKLNSDELLNSLKFKYRLFGGGEPGDRWYRTYSSQDNA